MDGQSPTLPEGAELELREKARDAIQAGRLPARRPDGVWGGRGAGVECAICGDIVSPDTLGFDLEFGPAMPAGLRDMHHVHIRCFAAWEVECQNVLPAGVDDGTISPCERPRPNGSGTS
jgi:hypothetical protein